MGKHGSMAATMASSSNTDKSNDKVHHTVTACVRCRQRKTRCDPTLPRCEPCERSNSRCEYYDSAKNKIVSRSYITSLQDTVRKLNEELQALSISDDYEPDDESMARAPGLVKFSETDDSRFLGPSSGIAVTRFVMDFARRNAAAKTIREVVPDHAAQEIKEKFDAESAKPTSKVYPLISSVAAPNLPNRGLMEQLLTIYTVKAQYMLPLLHEPSFREHVDHVYAGSTDPTLNFQVRMVIAISMQKLDTQYAGLADSYYLAALPHLTDAVRKMDITTLQCFVLIAQYSLLTPTRTAAYWIIGLAAKLCLELGLCDESSIEKPPSGARLNFLEVDMRRRLFWIVLSMEYGLAHSLGRPNAFGTTVDNIDVKFFELCDDQYITPDGLAPGAHNVMKKCIAVHFFKMRLLQAEIRRTLYLKKREAPVTDRDPWFQTMLTKIDTWLQSTPKNDEGSGLSAAWFEGRKNTMIVFMYRPSPQIPKPSVYAATRCYEAATYNITLQKKQVENSLIDITWIFTQAIFMALNTILWSISYPEIRQEHSAPEVKRYIDDGLQAILLCAERWPGVRSAHQLYGTLVDACLKAYDIDVTNKSPLMDNVSQRSAQDLSSSASQTAHSPASTAPTSVYGPQSPQSTFSHPSAISSGAVSEKIAGAFDAVTRNMHLNQSPFGSVAAPMNYHQHAPVSPPTFGQPLPYSSQVGTPTSQAPGPTDFGYDLPAWDTMAAMGLGPDYGGFHGMQNDDQPWLVPYGDEYAQYAGPVNGHMSYRMQSLTQQDQIDLLTSLEQTRLPDLDGLVSDTTTLYTANLP